MARAAREGTEGGKKGLVFTAFGPVGAARERPKGPEELRTPPEGPRRVPEAARRPPAGAQRAIRYFPGGKIADPGLDPGTSGYLA